MATELPRIEILVASRESVLTMSSKDTTKIPVFISRLNCKSLGGVVSPIKPVAITGIAEAEGMAAI